MDLRVTKTNGLTELSPGQPVSYSIVVSNQGPATAVGAIFRDDLPSFLQDVTFASTATGGATVTRRPAVYRTS